MNAQVTLLDSLQKRCTFMEHAAAAAGLRNVTVRWARAEDAGQAPALREQHQLAVARAVAELRLLAELCLPLVAPGGHWVAAKGPGPQASAVSWAAVRCGACDARLSGLRGSERRGYRTAKGFLVKARTVLWRELSLG